MGPRLCEVEIVQTDNGGLGLYEERKGHVQGLHKDRLARGEEMKGPSWLSCEIYIIKYLFKPLSGPFRELILCLRRGFPLIL